MIKGVNKQVLEISETENGFFEKALFFVKPEYSDIPENKLRADAQKRLKTAGNPPTNKHKTENIIRLRLPVILSGLFGLVIGMAIAFGVK